MLFLLFVYSGLTFSVAVKDKKIVINHFGGVDNLENKGVFKEPPESLKFRTKNT